MPEETGRQRDFVLAPNEYLFVQDRAKGQFTVHVGPTNGTLQAGNEPVTYDSKTDRFKPSHDVQSAILVFPTAKEGEYIVLANPSTEERRVHPASGEVNSFTTKLDSGRRIIIPGPQTFALWPGQVATVVPGHQLRTNQYLVANVYNDEAARANWGSAVVKPADTVVTPSVPPSGKEEGDKGAGDGSSAASTAPPSPAAAGQQEPPKFTLGQRIIIKGTDTSFFIPPTGLEVVPDENQKYVREALTLERLEHCILLSEGGEKRFVRGPAVVFPDPTEKFVTDGEGSRKFRAIELNPDMGLYIKVTADYTEDGAEHKAGHELFITGREQSLYFPRAEHKLIRYGDKEIHYGIAIPKGEARYVLDKNKGSVELVVGPQIFLPDPRTQVIVRRVLTETEADLWFPNNARARDYNATLRAAARTKGADAPLEEMEARDLLGARPRSIRNAVTEAAVAAYSAGDTIDRGTAHTPPRTITLDTKFEGAVAINVWNGYAVLVIDKKGNQRVEVGPKTVLLQYDETLAVLAFSKGKPKTTDAVERSVYLKVRYNQVSDIVEVVTADMVKALIKLSYRVNFEGKPEDWFEVENYVKALCDRCRSLLRNAASRLTIEQLNATHTDQVRDTILGEKPVEGERKGRLFEENGVRIYDVEVLSLDINDPTVALMLVKMQQESVQRALSLAKQEGELADTKRSEEMKREHAVEQAKTREHAADLQSEEQTKTAERAAELAEKKAELETESIERESGLTAKRHELAVARQGNDAALSQAEQEVQDAVATASLARDKATAEQRLALEEKAQEQKLKALEAEVKAVADKAKAIGPDLVAALSAFSEKDSALRLAQALSPLAILGGNSVAEVLGTVLANTSIGETAKKALQAVIGSPKGDNGGIEPPRASR